MQRGIRYAQFRWILVFHSQLQENSGASSTQMYMGCSTGRYARGRTRRAKNNRTMCSLSYRKPH